MKGMSELTLYVSPPGTGKTTHCVDLFRAEVQRTASGIDSRAYFVLPSREHAERIQNLVLKQGVPGLFNAHILTLNELFGRLIGASPANRPGDALRQSLVRQALSEACAAGEAPMYAGSEDLPGLSRCLADTAKELTAALISPDDLERRWQGRPSDPGSDLKRRSLLAVLRRYGAHLRRLGLREPEDDIDKLFTTQPTAAPDLVLLDGFYHFTRAQRRILEAVGRMAKRCVVTLTQGSSGGARDEMFVYVRATRRFLSDIGYVERSLPTVKSKTGRYRTHDRALLHLEKNLFAEARPAAVRPDAIRILSAPGHLEEMRSVARQLLELYRDHSYRYSDFCLIFRQVGPYDSALRWVFAEYGIPVHVHERRRLLENGVIKTLYEILGVYVSGWPSEATLAVLGSSYLGSGADWSGRRALRDLMRRHAADPSVPIEKRSWTEAAAASGGKVAATIEKLAALEDELVGARSAQDLGRILLEEAERLTGGAQTLEDREALSALRSLLNGWRRYYTGSGGRAFDAVRHLGELRGALESGLFSVRPPDRNRVQVYDVVMALPKEYKVVFVCGLSDKVFPREVLEDPVLSDEDRARIDPSGEALAPRALRASGEKYFFYMAVTRARERLFLSYPSHDVSGRPCAPSVFVRQVRDLYTHPPEQTRCGIGEQVDIDRCEAETELKRSVAVQLFGSEGSTHPAAPALADRLLVPGGLTRWAYMPGQPELKDPRALAWTAARKGPYSASQLETYSTCAFRDHCERNLQLSSNEDKSAARIGSLVHLALEYYFVRADERLKRDSAYLDDPERLLRDLGRLCDEALLKDPLSDWPEYRRRTAIKDVRRMLRRFVELELRVRVIGRTPTYFEKPFGMPHEPDTLPALRITHEGESAQLHGYLDRVDLGPGPDEALVIDYKSGKRPEGIGERLREDLEYQLPMYLAVVSQLLGRRPSDAQLRALRQAHVESFADTLERDRDGDLPATLEEAMEQLPARVMALSRRLRSGDIRVEPKTCKYCPYDAVCRYDRWRPTDEAQD
ncbi:MAG: ATP-dependent helicase/deoxyribonuclease subunit B [Candidatus Omnitrophica bacterium]|nr:ATP-dependent helicase/deoxyribonuclease subunit B [Candidatus Omnitrophota bacterium]